MWASPFFAQEFISFPCYFWSIAVSMLFEASGFLFLLDWQVVLYCTLGLPSGCECPLSSWQGAERGSSSPSVPLRLTFSLVCIVLVRGWIKEAELRKWWRSLLMARNLFCITAALPLWYCLRLNGSSSSMDFSWYSDFEDIGLEMELLSRGFTVQ